MNKPEPMDWEPTSQPVKKVEFAQPNFVKPVRRKLFNYPLQNPPQMMEQDRKVPILPGIAHQINRFNFF